MSEDPIEDAYEKYIAPEPSPSEPKSDVFTRQSEVPCRRCGSDDVDRTRGYRGEYKCNDCGYVWQVGGRRAIG